MKFILISTASEYSLEFYITYHDKHISHILLIIMHREQAITAVSNVVSFVWRIDKSQTIFTGCMSEM